MEQYIRRLSECQQNETKLREERETLLKRHERELEELDNRMTTISQQRTVIIDEFKQFLDSIELLQQNQTLAGSQTSLVGCGSNTATSKLCRAESAEATLGDDTCAQTQPEAYSFQPLLTVQTDTHKSTSSPRTDSLNSTPNNSASHSPNPLQSNADESLIIRTDAEEIGKGGDTKQVQNVKKMTRPLKIIHRLTTSKSAGCVPSISVVASPTTTQIESMLTKVRENVHSLDDTTLNQCIDLLSSRVFKDKDQLLGLNTPILSATKPVEPFSAEALKGIKEEVTVAKSVTKEKEKEKVDEQTKPIPTSNNTISARVPPVEPLPETTSLPESVSSSPKQPESPKKRIETPEERRRRIERVLFAKPNNSISKGLSTHSLSTTSLNEIDLSSSSSVARRSILKTSANNNRYNRGKGKVRRNHSLSPLRFGQRVKEANEDIDELETDDNSTELRRFKSDQQLDSDSFSLATPDGDSSNETEIADLDLCDNPKVEFVDNVQEDDHLLAPSKVAKSQDLFKQVFFPADTRQKALMSQEELARTRATAIGAKIKAKSFDSATINNRDSESPDSSSLRVDYLSHLRRNSASPEQRQRERELNSLNNTHKFRCYQDFWETKTKEIIDKKNQFSQWQQQSTQNNNGGQQSKPRKLKLVSTPSNANNTNTNNSTKDTLDTKNKKENLSLDRNKSSAVPVSVVPPSKLVVNNSNSNKKLDTVKPQTNISKHVPAAVAKMEKAEKTEKSSFTPVTKSQDDNKKLVKEKSNQVEDFENDQLMQRLRHIQQDIRQRRIKQHNMQQAQQQQQQQQLQQLQQQQRQLSRQHNLAQRPTMQSAKSLDLQYYPLKQQPKSEAIRIVHPNGSEPVPTKNRIRVIRSTSQENDDLMHQLRPIDIHPADLDNMMMMQQKQQQQYHHNQQHQHQQQHRKHSPLISAINVPNSQMRSTYF